MDEIKNVIFDLGGVLMNLDYDKTTTAFIDLGYTDFKKMYTQFQANNVFENLEKGQITEAEFYNYMNEVATGPIDKDNITKAWNAMLLDFRMESFAFLEQLSQSRKLFLLSNTNIIHKRALESNFNRQTGMPSPDIYFSKAYYSHLVGMRKPNEDIFKFVLEDAALDPSETLFVDDLYANIETAKKLGIKTYQLKPGEKIEDLNYH